jgi:YfiH family protein
VSDELVFELPGGGRALFTTRAAGNLSSGTGDGHEQGLRRRGEMSARLGVRWLCSSEQVHGTAVHVIERVAGTEGTPVPIAADGHATALEGVGAMILSADCLPVALGCKGAVAMLHAGWRGLAGGVLEEGVRVMRELAGGEDLLAVVGPGAGACCYEVGAEVHAAFAHDRPGTREHGSSRERGPIDLRAIAHERLLAAGVARVEDVEACTICDERFFSHRREGARAGRQAGIAWLS